MFFNTDDLKEALGLNRKLPPESGLIRKMTDYVEERYVRCENCKCTIEKHVAYSGDGKIREVEYSYRTEKEAYIDYYCHKCVPEEFKNKEE